MIKSIISHAFSRLNSTNNGDKKFEIFCQKLIPLAIDPYFLPSSGLDSGGDGGKDGWSPLGESGKIKYAFSINANSKGKIQDEINKTNSDEYNEIRFFTNQHIKEKDKQTFYDIHLSNNMNVLIYDLDNLIEFVERYESLGQFLDLPWIRNNITIEYLKKHNQLLSERDNIAQFIPRTISVWNEDIGKWNDISLVEYCSNLPLLTIIQAPAGYGKTCALKQLHQKILDKEVNTFLPPVYISLSSYIPTTLSSVIKDSMSESDNFRSNDYLLFLDGLDEVRDTDRDLLLKELKQLIDNKSIIRKVIITVRENTFNFSNFDVFDEYRKALLCELSIDDIKQLFNNLSIDTTTQELFFNDKFFMSFSKNIFYVINFIAYYMEHHDIAGNIITLFDFIIAQEVSRLFRQNIPDHKSLESLALFMTLNQILEIDDNNVSNSLNLKLPMQPFKFSHKSIQEYLAAQFISNLSIDTIKRLLAKGNIIIPHLTNTLGFLLNILNSTDEGQDTFENLVTWSLEGTGNAKRLLQIEVDKIADSMNKIIFKKVLEQEALYGDLFHQPESLIPFGLRDDCKSENINYLIAKIKGCRNNNTHHYYTSILQSITYNYIDLLDDKSQQDLIDFLIELLDANIINNNIELIESLLYSIAYFPKIIDIDNNKIDLIVSQLLSIDKSENIVDNLCQLLLTSKKNLDLQYFYQIFDFILDRVLRERGQMAHFVPTQTTDDTYHEPLKITHWRTFIILANEYLSHDSSLVWKFMEYTNQNHEKITDRHSSSSEFNELFDTFFNILLKEVEIKRLDDNKKNILIDWIINDSKNYVDSKLWKFLVDHNIDTYLADIAMDVISKAGKQYFNRDIMVYFMNKEITTNEKFDWFKKEFYENKNESLQSFFETFCFWIKDDHPIYEYVISNIPSSLLESIEKSKLKQEEYLSQSAIDNEIFKNDYYIAFKLDDLKEEINKIFIYFKKDNIKRDVFWDHYHKRLLNEINRFALYLFQSTYWAKEESVSRKKILDYLKKENWEKNFMTFLIQFSFRNKIDINDFNIHEKQKIIKWVKYVLNEYPLDTIDSPLKYIHITLSHVLRNSKFLNDDTTLMDLYKEKMIGLSFSAFPNIIEGAVIVNSDSYSISYLDKYFSPKRIIAFITNNFPKAFSNYQKMISLCGYLLNHIDDIFPYQKKKLKDGLTEYIRDNLLENYYPSITDCSFALGFSITDISKERLSEGFVLNENKSDLAYNYASSFISYNRHTNTCSEVEHLSKALYIAFKKSENSFHKKTIAEYYLKYNEMGGDVFQFYAEYLLEDDSHTILNSLIHGGSNVPLKTADIKHLEIVKKLFQYSRAKEARSERRDGILSIAISSYKAMAEKAENRMELDMIINAMDTLAKEGYDFLYRYIQEIENDFAERTYKSLSIKEIVEIANSL